MDFESFHCSYIIGVEEMVTASLLILLMNGTKKTYRNDMDRVGLILVSVLNVEPWTPLFYEKLIQVISNKVIVNG